MISVGSSDQENLAETVADLKEKNPCPTCCQNLKHFQGRVKSLEARSFQAEQSRDSFQLKNIELFEKYQLIFGENQELKAKLRDLTWKPTVLESMVAQVYVVPRQ